MSVLGKQITKNWLVDSRSLHPPKAHSLLGPSSLSLPRGPATAPACPFLPLPSALTRPSRHAGASWAARGLEVAAAHFGTEGETGVLDLGLAPIASEARGAGAVEAGGHGRGGAGGAGKGGKKGVAAASILAGLGILAGVRKLACLTQEARGTPGRGGERRVYILTLCSHLPPSFAFICFSSSASPPSFLLSSHSPHPFPCSPSSSPTPTRCTHWQVPCPWDRLRQVPPLAQGSGKLPHCSPRDGDEGEMGAGSITLLWMLGRDQPAAAHEGAAHHHRIYAPVPVPTWHSHPSPLDPRSLGY